jgi:hypothetical protein
MTSKFDNLMVLGRPASGKSEFLDFMKNQVTEAQRLEKFHIGKFVEIDDFPWIWEKFMDDDVWEKVGQSRKYSANYMPNNPGMAPHGSPLFDFCMEKFNVEIDKRYLQKPEFYNENTLLIEFARGGENGFEHALNLLSKPILEKSSIFFIYVTPGESWRRNVARYEENKRHSILSHMVPKETYDCYYTTHDWLELTKEQPHGYVTIKGINIPFVTMNNEPESTDPVILNDRYGPALRKLMELQKNK